MDPAEKQLSLITKKEDADENLGYKSLDERKTPELVFVLVEPIGGGAQQVQDALRRVLEAPEYGYEINEIRMSSTITEEAKLIQLETPDLPEELKRIPTLSEKAKRIHKMQQLGNILRDHYSNDFLARKAIESITNYRHTHYGIERASSALPVAKPLRVAHIIRSIKNESELNLLKSVYGNILFLIAVSGSRDQQIENYFSECTTDEHRDNTEKEYDVLSDIDQEEGPPNGQQVRLIFYKSDLFLNSKKESLEKQLKTFLQLLFGKAIKSPTDEESLMFHAFLASLKSTCLSRQVGAAISDINNDLISIGWNDVPAYGGGLASDHSASSKGLCKNKGKCRSTEEISKLVDNTIRELKLSGQLIKNHSKQKISKALKQAGLKGLIEFSRAIHAEMEALLSAARAAKKGLRGGTIFVTTYPCDNCAKHILAAGLNRVVYIEPYPKSRAKDFFSDFIIHDEEGHDEQNRQTKLIFSQFVGISPRAYALLYEQEGERKDKEGVYVPRTGLLLPRTNVYLDSYTLYEGKILEELKKCVSKSNASSR